MNATEHVIISHIERTFQCLVSDMDELDREEVTQRREVLTKGINIGDPRGLEVCAHILVVTDATWRPLQPTYEDPYKVFERGEHSFRLDIGGKLKRSFRLAPFLQGIDATGGSLSARLVLISATQRLRSSAQATGFLARKPLGSVGSGVLWQDSIPSSHRPRSILFIFRYDFSWY